MTFLMIARILYDKGYQEYVNAATIVQKEYPNTEFQLLGNIDKDYPNYVPEEIVRKDNSEGKINYVGFKADVKPFIRKADCIVHPTYHEGMSRVLMEALAMSKPIITTDIPGCREMIENEKNGYLVSPHSTESLVIAIRKFLNLTNDERIAMGEYARKKAEQEFDVKDVIAVYKSITQGI